LNKTMRGLLLFLLISLAGANVYSFRQFHRGQGPIQKVFNTSYEYMTRLCDEMDNCRAFNNDGDLFSSDQVSSDQSVSTYVKITGETLPDIQLDVWPLPKSYTSGDQTLDISPHLFQDVVVESKILQRALSRYDELIFSKGKEANGPTSEFNLGIEDWTETLSQETDENYTLQISSSGISLKSHGIFGAMRGLETLSQMIVYNFDDEKFRIKNCPWLVVDEPTFVHRGFMMDTARHFQSIQILKDLLRSLSFAKMNVFHWHIVDANSFPVQIKRFPKLWEGAYSKSERYTQSEVKSLVEYAKDFGIRVIVEFDNPGHMYSWGKGYPELLPENYQKAQNCYHKCPNDCNVPIDPSEPRSYEVLSGCRRECRHNFAMLYRDSGHKCL